MAFSSWQEFIHMGGHALYVWTAYAIVLTGLLLLILHSHFSHQRWRARQQQQALLRNTPSVTIEAIAATTAEEKSSASAT